MLLKRLIWSNNAHKKKTYYEGNGSPQKDQQKTLNLELPVLGQIHIHLQKKKLQSTHIESCQDLQNKGPTLPIAEAHLAHKKFKIRDYTVAGFQNVCTAKSVSKLF